MCSACIQKRCTVFLRQYIVNRYFHTLPIHKFKYFFVTHFSCIFKFVKFFGKFRIVFINKQADYVHFFFVLCTYFNAGYTLNSVFTASTFELGKSVYRIVVCKCNGTESCSMCFMRNLRRSKSTVGRS